MRLSLPKLRDETRMNLDHLLSITPHAHKDSDPFGDTYRRYNSEQHWPDGQSRCARCTLLRLTNYPYEEELVDIEIDIRTYWRTR